VIGLPMGFIPHVFFPDQTAESIGWPTGSPFQFEVGVHDGAWGVLGFLCIWIGGLFWLATGLGWSLFMLGATYGHIRETVIKGGLCSVQLLHHLLRRIHRHLDPGASLPLLAPGRLSEISRPGLLAGCHGRRYLRYTPPGRLAAGAFLANRVRSGRKQP
jgi:hypothetical protein